MTNHPFAGLRPASWRRILMCMTTDMTANDAVVATVKQLCSAHRPAITQAQLAVAIGMLPNTLQLYLTDTMVGKYKRRPIRVDALEQIAKGFGLNASELLAKAEKLRQEGIPGLVVDTHVSGEVPLPDEYEEQLRLLRNEGKSGDDKASG